MFDLNTAAKNTWAQTLGLQSDPVVKIKQDDKEDLPHVIFPFYSQSVYNVYVNNHETSCFVTKFYQTNHR